MGCVAERNCSVGVLSVILHLVQKFDSDGIQPTFSSHRRSHSRLGNADHEGVLENFMGLMGPFISGGFEGQENEYFSHLSSKVKQLNVERESYALPAKRDTRSSFRGDGR